MNGMLLKTAARAVRKALPGAQPVGGLITGSGWDLPSGDIRVLGRIAYRNIPALGQTTVAGHAGQLLWCEYAGCKLFVFQGRRHWYEGRGWEPIAAPIHILKSFGAQFVILTNAAGGIRADLTPGTLMVIDDQINAMGAHPLTGAHDPFWGARFPDQTAVYDRGLRQALVRAARRGRCAVKHGVYLAVCGPTYETPAEVKAFQSWGADAVGMSTVPEAILANAAGLQVGGISFIANRAAGRRRAPLTHAEVLAATKRAKLKMRALLREFFREIQTRPLRKTQNQQTV